MKRILSLAFALALGFGTVLAPVHAQDVSVHQTVAKNPIDWIDGSIASLSENKDAFYAMSLLANGMNEEQMRKSEEVFLTEAASRLSNPRTAATDVEKMILLVESYGYDATAYELNGTVVNLFDMLAEMKFHDVNSYVFALEAINAAGYTPEEGSALQPETLIQKLISMRNEKDHAWNYNGNYEGSWGSSDTDTTAMVLSSLAPYVNKSASETGISEATKMLVTEAAKDGFHYLSDFQTETGAMKSVWSEGNSNTTAVTILAFVAYGKDLSTDVQFTKNGRSLMDGMMDFALEDKSGFGYKNNEDYDTYGNEQSLRSLIAYANAKAGVPYYFYQAAAIKHQDRFKVETPDVDEMIDFSGTKDIFANDEVIEKIQNVLKAENSEKAVVRFDMKNDIETIMVPEALFETVKETGKSLTIELMPVSGKAITWKFQNVKDAKDVNIKVDITDGKTLKLKNIDENAMVLNFAHKGSLPAQTTVSFYAGDKFQNGDTVRVSYYNEQTKTLEEAKEYTVKDGYIQVTLAHCSSYIVEKVEPEHTETPDVPNTSETETPDDINTDEKGKETENADAIKETGKRSESSTVALLMMIAGAGYIVTRRYAE